MSDKLTRFLEEFDRATKDVGGAERALYLLLRDNAAKLPPLDDGFHKAFRQTDITERARVDLAIWHLIGHSKVFWRCFQEVQPKQSAEAHSVQPGKTSP